MPAGKTARACDAAKKWHTALCAVLGRDFNSKALVTAEANKAMSVSCVLTLQHSSQGYRCDQGDEPVKRSMGERSHPPGVYSMHVQATTTHCLVVRAAP